MAYDESAASASEAKTGRRSVVSCMLIDVGFRYSEEDSGVIRRLTSLVHFSMVLAAVKKVCNGGRFSIYIDSFPRHCPV
jgi:hypothetical protein